MCFYVIGIIENMHKVYPELNQIKCDCEERHYFEQNKETQRIFLDEPRENEKRVFIDRITPKIESWRFKVRDLYFRQFENEVKWDENEI